MIKGRPLYFAIGLLTLCVQVAAAAHSPAFHDEPVVQCQDHGAHFCPERVEHETGPCVLCHVSIAGVYCERLEAAEAVLVSEPAVAPCLAPPVASGLSPTHAPRGPPVG